MCALLSEYLIAYSKNLKENIIHNKFIIVKDMESEIKGPNIEFISQNIKNCPSDELLSEESHQRSIKLKSTVYKGIRSSVRNSMHIKLGNSLDLMGINNESIKVSDVPKKSKGLAGIISKLYIVLNFIMKLKELSCVRKPKWLTEWHFSLIGDQSFFYKSYQKMNNRAKNNDKSMISKLESSGQKDEAIPMLKRFQKFLQSFLELEIFKKYKVFDPCSKRMFFFDIIHLLFILYFFITIPIHISFGFDPYYYCQRSFKGYFLFIFVPFVFFLFDFSVKVRKGYYKRGKLVNNRKKIAQHYFKKEFFLDFFSILFLILRVFFVSFEEKGSNFDFAIKLLSCLFFIRLRNFEKIMEEIEEYLFLDESSASAFSLFNLLYRTILILHILSCLWNLVGEASVDSNGVSWLASSNIKNANWSTKYLYSYYFIVITMNTVGYGDISPTNNGEIIFTIFLVYFACGIFAYSINCIGNIINDITRIKSEFRRKISVMNGFMRKKGITFNLRRKVRKYLEFLWLEESSQNQKEEEKILNSLSDSLKKNLLLEANGTALKSLKAFTRNFSEEVLRQCAFSMKEQRYIPGDILFNKGDVSNKAIYIVKKGEIEITANDVVLKNNSTVNLKVGKTGSFGEISFFSNQPRTFSAVSSDFTTLFCISREDFLKILNEFPVDKERFCAISTMIDVYGLYSALKMNCAACKKDTHSLETCSWLHLPIFKETMIYRYLHSIPHERKSGIQRRISKFSLKKIKMIVGGARTLTSILNETEVRDLEESSKDDNSDIFQEPNKKVSNIYSNGTSQVDEIYSENEAKLEFDDSQSDVNSIKSVKNNKRKKKEIPIEYDRVLEFTEYFPKFNISKVLKRFNREMYRYRRTIKSSFYTRVERSIVSNMKSRFKKPSILPRKFEKTKKNFFHVPSSLGGMMLRQKSKQLQEVFKSAFENFKGLGKKLEQKSMIIKKIVGKKT